MKNWIVTISDGGRWALRTVRADYYDIDDGRLEFNRDDVAIATFAKGRWSSVVLDGD